MTRVLIDGSPHYSTIQNQRSGYLGSDDGDAT